MADVKIKINFEIDNKKSEKKESKFPDTEIWNNAQKAKEIVDSWPEWKQRRAREIMNGNSVLSWDDVKENFINDEF